MSNGIKKHCFLYLEIVKKAEICFLDLEFLLQQRGLIREPVEVDFYVDSQPLIKEEKENNNQHIRTYFVQLNTAFQNT